MAALGTGGKQGTTEWEDILRSKGILPPEKSADELASDTLKAMVEERVESYDPHAAKDVSALDVDLEEADEEEEAILRTYRDARLAEMKAASTKRRYGPGIAYISATDWKAEVTNAEQDLPVVVLLFVQTDECRRMEQLLLTLSAAHVFVKFVKCKAGDALKNYPDSQCPTLLIYKGGTVLKQFIKFDSFGGAKATVEDIEWELSKLGVVSTELTSKPSADSKRFQMRRL
nr:PhM00076.1 [Neoporphyra haitanensis]WOE55313.1 PhF00076.1 [Neoporphyra haitanensis]